MDAVKLDVVVCVGTYWKFMPGLLVTWFTPGLVIRT